MSDRDRIVTPTRRPLGADPRAGGRLPNDGGFDAHTGQPQNIEDVREQMQRLLREQTEQVDGIAPSPPAARGPNVRENVRDLPPDRIPLNVDRLSDEVPYIEEGGPDAEEIALRQRRLAERQGRPAPIDGPPPRRQPPITNRQPGPQAPPPISQAQYDAKRKRARDEEKPIEQNSEVYVGKPRFVIRQPQRSGKFTRVPLLSGFIFYPFKDLQVRKINLPIQIAIATAQRTRNITGLIDAIGATLEEGIDVRDLCLPDFFFLLYWHRFNSYTSTPFVVNWTSKYGNKNEYKITDTNLKYNPPKMTEDRYQEWLAKGFAVPTVRDFELYSTENLNEEEVLIFQRAQYFVPKPREDGEPADFQDKIDAMADMCEESIEALELLNQFREELGDFGVEESVDVTDARFDPQKWASDLELQAEFLREEAEGLRVLNAGMAVARIEEAREMDGEAAHIRNQLEKGEQVLPDVETIRLTIGVLDFFPFV